MKQSRLIGLVVLWLFATPLHAFNLESFLPIENDRTKEAFIAEIENLPESKRSAFYREIDVIAGLSREDFLAGNFEMRPCQTDEILDTAGFDPNTGELRYAPRFCRNDPEDESETELVAHVGDVVFGSAGCGNPSRGIYEKIEVLVEVPQTAVVHAIIEERPKERRCYVRTTFYAATHQSIETGDDLLQSGFMWGKKSHHLYSGDSSVDVPIFVGADETICEPEH